MPFSQKGEKTMEEFTTKGIMIFNQNLKDFSFLTDEQAGKVIKALANYYIDGAEPEDLDESITQMVFSHLQENADWSLNKYQRTCDRNKKVSDARWSKKQDQPKLTRGYQKVPSDDSGYQKVPLVDSGTKKVPVEESEYHKVPLVDFEYQNIPEKNVVLSGNQEVPEVPVVQYNIIESNNIESNKVEVDVDVDVDVDVAEEGVAHRPTDIDTDIDSNPIVNSSPRQGKKQKEAVLAKLKDECAPYLDTDENDMISNLRILLRTYSPEEVKNAVVRSHGYSHSADWKYITQVCKNTRAENELILRHSQGLDVGI